MISLRTPRISVRLCCALIAAAMIASSASAVSAALVGADLSGTTPTNWTPVASGTVNNLVDETGAPTAIDITVASTEFKIAQGLNAGTIPIHTNPLNNLSGFETGPQLITFSDLVPSAVYKFWLFVVYDNLGGAVTFNANVLGAGPVQTYTFGPTVAGDLWINGQVGSNAALDSFAVLVTASATGTIEVRFANSTTGEEPVSGVAIELTGEVVPTPAAAPAILGLLALSTLRRRRCAA